MKKTYPHSIQNSIGEKLTFLDKISGPEGDRLMVENFVVPGAGPLMHKHFLQDECLTVVEGKLGYEILGEPVQLVGAGETVLFKRGVAHRFWNAGDAVLHCEGWIQPAHSFEFFISSVFAAQNRAGGSQPERFDAAYLLTRYASEFELSGLPKFVKKIIIPVTYRVGRVLGKYKKFKNAPSAVQAA